MNITYPFSDLVGGGSTTTLTASTPYTFTITNTSGSSHLVLESLPNNSLEGSITSTVNIPSPVITNHIIGMVLPSGVNSFIYTPLQTTTVTLRGTGGIVLNVVD